MTGWNDSLANIRVRAVAEASAKLQELEFSLQPSGDWKGKLETPNSSVIVLVRVPQEFPDKLPEIFLETPSQSPVQAHIEQSGKICIATTSGNLLDVERPSTLIENALDRARAALSASAAEQHRDVQLEFVSYWPERNTDSDIWTIADPDRGSREIVCSYLALNGNHLVFANNEEQLELWARRTKAEIRSVEASFFACLSGDAMPPLFNQSLSTTDFVNFLRTHMAGDQFEEWRRWDSGRRPNAAILLARKVPDDSWAVVAVRPAELTSAQDRAMQNRYSGKKPSAQRIRDAIRDNPIRRRAVVRADETYLLQRTIGSPNLHDVRVAIIGCGAIGSQIAIAVPASGAKKVALVDGEKLRPENVARHALGSSDIGKWKATALGHLIECRFPHVDVVSMPNTVEFVFNNQPDFVDDFDILVLALGDETLERRLNSFLGNSVIRIHTWIEPYGLGGHCLVVPGNSHKGCFECLYARDADSTLYNMASLSARGQVFQKTMGGCAGTFSEFGYADTLDAAARTMHILIDVATNTNIEHKLLSWVGDETTFLKNGFLLSERGKDLTQKREECRRDISRHDCRVCANW